MANFQDLPGLEILWSAERQLMRLEALLASQPNAAIHWRSQVALIEAVRSTELNDYILDPATLLLALMQQQAARSRSDAGAVRHAEAVWHALSRATGSGADFAACANIGGGGLLTIHDEEAHLDGISPPDRVSWALSKIEQLGRYHSQPLLPRLTVVPHILREINGEPAPIAERVWMMLADQKWRRPDPIIEQHRPEKIRGKLLLDTPNQARWIIAPSSILSLRGPGIWNLDAADFRDRFIRNADSWIARQLDNLLSIVRWEAQELAAYAYSGRDGARVAFSRLLARMPIVDAALVARQLKVHERTARRVLSEAAEAGVVTELMGRYQYRIWAAPSLAQWAESTHQDRRKRMPRLRRSSDRDEDDFPSGADAADQGAEPTAQIGWDENRADKDARLQAMLDELDVLSKGVLAISKQTISSVEAEARGGARPKQLEEGERGWLAEET